MLGPLSEGWLPFCFISYMREHSETEGSPLFELFFLMMSEEKNHLKTWVSRDRLF